MGANSSSFNELSTNEYLKRLSSPEPINPIDPYWNQLLSFSFLIPINSSDGKLLEESTSSICKGVAINNCRSGNFGALIRNFLVRATELKASVQCEDNIFTWQTYNALFIIRSLSKYFVEHLSEELILQQFEAKPKEMGGYKDPEEMGPLLEELMNSLVEMLVDVPVMNFTYALHLEALNTLLVLMSIQMFQPQPAHKFTVYQIMMQGRCSIHACVLVKVLLRNFCNQEKCPPELYRQSSDMNSMVASVAASLWSVMTLGMGAKTEKKEEEFQETLLANQSLLFLLVLTNHCTGERGVSNPYREALFSFTNIHEESSVSQVAATFKMDYNLLFSALCSTLRDDQTTLLLYLLIHRNSGVKAFIFSRTNIDQLCLINDISLVMCGGDVPVMSLSVVGDAPVEDSI
uniref:Dymeclin n=1 Tax=Magallana gigas TaxID=29159 RepID=K1PRE0_MAGGI